MTPLGAKLAFWGLGTSAFAGAAILQVAPWLPEGSIEKWTIATFLLMAVLAFWRGWVVPGTQDHEKGETIKVLNAELKDQSESYTRLAEQRAEDRAEKEFLNRQLGELSGKVEAQNVEIRGLQSRISELLTERAKANDERDDAMRRFGNYMDEQEGAT